jgi:hypothetical protein
MSRLLTLALALIAVTAFAPINAFAWGGHGFGGGHGWAGRGWAGHFGGRYDHFGIFRRPILSGYPYARPYYYGNSGYDPGCVWVRQLVQTQYGPQWRVTPACAYGD